MWIRRTSITLLTFYILFLTPQVTIADEITVQNDPNVDVEPVVTANVVGIRPIAAKSLGSTFRVANIQFSQELILNAALQFPEIKKELDKIGQDYSSLTIPQIKEAIIASGYVKQNLYEDNEQPYYSYNDVKIIESPITTDEELRYWDAGVIVNVLATGVLDPSEYTMSNHNEKTMQFIGFEEQYKPTINNIYSSLTYAGRTEFHNASYNLDSTKTLVREYKSLERALLRSIGEITFGHPLIYSASEIGLVLPQSVTSEFDVYWVELSATFRQLSTDDLIELSVNFAFPPQNIALELIPLSYGTEIEVGVDVNTPELSVKAGGTEVSIGEFFRKSVKFSYIKPTVVAFGLRENRFSWTLQKEAVRAGSHKFVAIVRVPKGTDSTSLGMSAHVRVSEKLWLGEQLAGTEQYAIKLNFP